MLNSCLKMSLYKENKTNLFNSNDLNGVFNISLYKGLANKPKNTTYKCFVSVCHSIIKHKVYKGVNRNNNIKW